MDITSEYLGLKLKNPLVASSSPLTGNLNTVRRLEDAGIAAIVLPSLFEEEIVKDQRLRHAVLDFHGSNSVEMDNAAQTNSYKSHLDSYLEKVQTMKKSLDIPLIASLNGHSLSGWISHAKQLEQAGCDALELNIYHVAASLAETAAEVEARYVLLLDALRTHLSIPITVKLSPQYTSLANFVQQLKDNGAGGVVLFNRFYQPDINLDTLSLEPTLQLSTPDEALERVRWIALLSKKINLSFAATGGFHRMDEILKALLVGADAVYLCSVLLQQGPPHVTTLLSELARWLENNNHESVRQIKGRLCQEHVSDDDAGLYERANYLSVLENYTPSSIKTV